MDILQAIILGCVEGFTEFLPVSSTGHLILTSALLQIPETDFLKTFEIVIQVGAIGAVCLVYWRRFLDLEVLKKLFVAFLPTGIIGFALYKVLKAYLIGNEMVVLAALALGGIVLIAFELLHKESPMAKEDIKKITYKEAFLIGLFQAVSIIPGVSRSAATIIGGLSLGIKRIAIVEFSFLLAVPTLVAATGYDLLKNTSALATGNLTLLLIGTITSFIVAYISIKFFLSYIRTHSFISFGIYRIAIAILFLFFVIH